MLLNHDGKVQTVDLKLSPQQTVSSVDTVDVLEKPTAVRVFKKDSVQIAVEQALALQGTTELMNPTQEELQHVAVLFKDKKWDNINLITYPRVSEIARHEFSQLNRELEKFNSQVTKMKSPGLFLILDTLTKKVSEAELEQLWTKASTAKPTLRSRILSWFDPKYAVESLQKQYGSFSNRLIERSKGLEAALSDIETKLVQQKHEQQNNIKMLETSSEMYFLSFQEIRTQFVFTLYLEEFYKQEVQKYREENAHRLQDLHVIKQLAEYDSIQEDIENKRLVLHGSLLKFPITVKQNENLISVCKNIVKEIDNTLMSNFLSIRTSLSGLAICLNSQQAMLGTESAKTLDEQLSSLNMQINKDLTLKAATYSADARMREANQIKSLIQQLAGFSQEIVEAKEKNRTTIEEATRVLNESTQELNYLLSQNRS